METTEGADGRKTITLSRVITYSALQQLVHQCRSSSRARSLGRTQFAQLAWLWSGGQAKVRSAAAAAAGADADAETAEPEEIHGLGFLIRKVRVPDPRTGKHAWDWGLGIELSVRRPKPVPAFEIGYPVAGPREAPSTPKLSSSPALGHGFPSPSPSTPKRSRLASGGDWTPPSSVDTAATNKETMNINTLWHNGMEARKQEISRRLRERAMQHVDLWEKEHDVVAPSTTVEVPVPISADTPPTTPRKPSHTVVMGAGGLLTPSATRSPDHKPGQGRVHDALASSHGRTSWPQGFDPKRLPPIPQAILPPLKDASTLRLPSLNARLAKATAASKEEAEAEPVDKTPMDPSLQGRTLSLQDRIKAKEARLRSKAGPAGLARGAGAKQALQRHRDQSILSRLPKVADCLTGLFAATSVSTSTHVRYARKSAREVLAAVKQVLSGASDEDAQNALDMVRKLAPTFLRVQTVQGLGEYYTRSAESTAPSPAALKKLLQAEIARVAAA